MREPSAVPPATDDTIFIEAMAVPPGARQEFIERSCGGNRDQIERVIALLAGYQNRSAFLEIAAPAAVLRSIGLDVSVSRPDPQPGDRVGRYIILERIGEGGFGIVYVAEQREPVRRRVALKLIRLGMDTCEFIARFEAERQALALMDHPNIARVLDAGATEHGRPYLVMELVLGVPITKYCDEHKLSLSARLRLAALVCDAVQHAHQKGVIHRDLKPSNILVAREADVPVPKVIDFGIAKAMSGPLTDKTLFTQQHTLIGTPAYTSPEQMEIGTRDVDTRSDVYSLGALLYELLTGHPPFDRATLETATFDEMRRTVREVPPARPSRRVAAMTAEEVSVIAAARAADPARFPGVLASELDWIVMRCLEKDRARRYETATALAQDIRHFLDNEPVVARPPSRGYRVGKFILRHRTPVFAATAVALSLIAGLIVASVLFLRERAAAEKSQQVAQFMKEMLGGVGPSVARGRDTTLLREVLDTTIRRLDTELRDQPEVAADLRHTLGTAFHAIGDYDRAARLWHDAVRTRRELGDQASVALAATLHELGSLLWRMNQVSEAESALQEALAIRRRTLGPDHFDVGTTLAAIAYNIGSPRYVRAREALLREALAIQRKHPGRNDDELAQTLLILGFVLSSDNRHLEAVGVLRESVAIRRRLHGGPHPHLAESIAMLARATAAERAHPQESKDEERALKREGLQMVREVRGVAHAKLVAALLNFTAGRLSAETLAEDLALVREVFGDLRKGLPEDSPDLAVAQLALASALDSSPESPAEVESLMRDAVGRIRHARANGVTPHRDTSAAMLFFVQRAHATGRVQHTVPMGEELNADPKFGSILTYGPPVARSLGYTYYDLGRYAEAASLLENNAMSERSPWRPLWRSVQRALLFVDLACAGDAHRHLGNLAKSRSILEAGLAREIDTGEEHDPSQAARAAVRGELGYTAMAEGKFAEAESLFREALEEYDAEPAVNQWDKHRPRGRIVSGLGQALAGQGKFVEAEPLIVEGFGDLVAKRKTFWGDPTRLLHEAHEAVVRVYRDAGEPDKAAEWELKKADL